MKKRSAESTGSWPLRRAIALALVVGGAVLTSTAAVAQQRVLPVSALDGRNGMRFAGVAASDGRLRVGHIGDFNGDGLGDVAIGVPFGTNGSNAGTSYVVFGRPGPFMPSIPVDTLDGSNGFRIDGTAISDESGSNVTGAGDLNGDGLADLVLTARGARRSYVIFGQRGTAASVLQLATLGGDEGFRIEGGSGVYDGAGYAATGVGDINGDGVDDLALGAAFQSNGSDFSGSTYVMFGRNSGFPPSLQLAQIPGSNGFRIDGAAANAYCGYAIAAAGDVNGDGVDDMIVGANGTSARAGAAYLIFGRSSGFPATLDAATLNGSDGIRMLSATAGERAGDAVAGAGDINGDGYDDVLIGAPSASRTATTSGSTYVVFGRASGFPATLSLGALDGSDGFRLDGVGSNADSGRALAGLGDINGDGIGDFAIGAPFETPAGADSGSAYLIFGRRSGHVAAQRLDAIGPAAGLRIDGASARATVGWSLAGSGDFDGDRRNDLMIGSTGYLVFPFALEQVLGDGFESP
jgi:hypothetical protein